ncbi:hypothetical protein [Treponema sp.]|uniref:hypothetical protein n=1 Tax=Treponema sp. TaxID=166 RepID=UPI003FD82202
MDRDLSENCMIIGTSAIIDTEIDGAVGMNSDIFNNPFIIWGRYKKKFFRYYLSISFQFHRNRQINPEIYAQKHNADNLPCSNCGFLQFQSVSESSSCFRSLFRFRRTTNFS